MKTISKKHNVIGKIEVSGFPERGDVKKGLSDQQIDLLLACAQWGILQQKASSIVNGHFREGELIEGKEMPNGRFTFEELATRLGQNRVSKATREAGAAMFALLQDGKVEKELFEKFMRNAEMYGVTVPKDAKEWTEEHCVSYQAAKVDYMKADLA